MTVAGSYGPILPELRSIIDEYSREFTVEPDAHDFIDQVLRNGTARILEEPDPDAALEDASSKLREAAEYVSQQLHAAGQQSIDVVLLLELLRAGSRCPLPPFWYGRAGDPDIGFDPTTDISVEREVPQRDEARVRS